MLKIFFALILMTGFAQASTFIDGLEDVPVPEGIKQIYNRGVNFGNEESRFIEIYLESDTLTFRDIKNFYQSTMPQLGWAPMANNKNELTFNRENEIIEIVLERVDPLMVRLTVKSRF